MAGPVSNVEGEPHGNRTGRQSSCAAPHLSTRRCGMKRAEHPDNGQLGRLFQRDIFYPGWDQRKRKARFAAQRVEFRPVEGRALGRLGRFSPREAIPAAGSGGCPMTPAVPSRRCNKPRRSLPPGARGGGGHAGVLGTPRPGHALSANQWGERPPGRSDLVCCRGAPRCSVCAAEACAKSRMQRGEGS
jgi:hypothetical protein